MNELNTQMLLIDCPDRTGVLYELGANIVSNHEFVEGETAWFFMRTEFAGRLDGEALLRETREVLPPGATVRLARGGNRNVVVMATREHHCLGELLLRHAYGELRASGVQDSVSWHRPDTWRQNRSQKHIGQAEDSRYSPSRRFLNV